MCCSGVHAGNGDAPDPRIWLQSLSATFRASAAAPQSPNVNPAPRAKLLPASLLLTLAGFLGHPDPLVQVWWGMSHLEVMMSPLEWAAPTAAPSRTDPLVQVMMLYPSPLGNDTSIGCVIPSANPSRPARPLEACRAVVALNLRYLLV